MNYSLSHYDIWERTGFLTDIHFIDNFDHISGNFIIFNNLIDTIKYNSQCHSKFEDEVQNIIDLYERAPFDIVSSINSSELCFDDVIKYLYCTLSIICHKYLVIESTKMKDKQIQTTTIVLPHILGFTWYLCAEKLGLPPVLTYAASNLYNWTYVKSGASNFFNNISNLYEPENLEILYSLTNDPNERWFYIISNSIEGYCANVIYQIYNLYTGYGYLSNKDININEELKSIIVCLEKCNKVIKRMYENCDPNFFYNKLRIYLRGSDNKELFPEGISIEDNVNNRQIKISYKGASAAQSSAIQLFDVLFNVMHTDHERAFLKEMREYMPKKHREFLEMIEKTGSLQKIFKFSDELYNKCIIQLSELREKHYGLVHNYILKFESNDAKGTGGTHAATLLSKIKENTLKSLKIDLTNRETTNIKTTNIKSLKIDLTNGETTNMKVKNKSKFQIIAKFYQTIFLVLLFTMISLNYFNCSIDVSAIFLNYFNCSIDVFAMFLLCLFYVFYLFNIFT